MNGIGCFLLSASKMVQFTKLIKITAQTSSHPPPSKSPSGTAFSASDRSELFADTFELQYVPNQGPYLVEVQNSITTIKNTITKNTDFKTPGTIELLIKNLPNQKAPGADLITNTALKNSPKSTILLLTNIFNGCLRLSYFPSH
jgi:hypothetical protein